MTARVKTVHKTNEHGFDGSLNAVLSDMTVDAYGDVIGDAAHPMLGWDITDFRRNPIALWAHDTRAPIGTWKDVSVANGKLLGRLQLAPPGATKLVDELRALLAADVLKGISVGFKPTESKPLGNGGVHYLRQTLVEASLVSTPANPAALLCAKALGVSKQTIAMVFKQGNQDDFVDMGDCVGQMIDDGMDADEAVAFCSVLFNEEQRLAKALKARDRALAEVKRIDDQIANEYSWAGQMQRQREETIANWTRAQQRMAPQDPPKPTYDPRSAPYGTWRGQKLPGPTWRGKPIK
jgi:HK97 family phage prohead protease